MRADLLTLFVSARTTQTAAACLLVAPEIRQRVGDLGEAKVDERPHYP
jgi:hypothetical protein